MHIQSPERTFYCLFNPGKPASKQQGLVGKKHLLSPFINIKNNNIRCVYTGKTAANRLMDVLLTPIKTTLSAVLVPFFGFKKKFGEV